MTNETQNTELTTPETLPEGYELMPVEISDATLDDLSEMAKRITTMAKLVEGGIEIDGTTYGDITGRITGVKIYLISFPGEGQPPEIIGNVIDDDDIPEGFSRRADVTIQCGSQLVQLKLPPYSTNYILPKYVTALADEGLRPEDVVTRVTSERKRGKNMQWNAAKFATVKVLNPSDKQTCKTENDIPL